MENQINSIQNCPPPSVFEKVVKPQNILEEKHFYLTFDKNQYELIITLFDKNNNNQENKFNFKLIGVQNNINNNNNNKYYYENNKYLTELSKLFLINVSKCSEPEKKILEKIEKFHLNNNVYLQINNNNPNNILNLIYILKTIDNDDLEFTIELFKKEEKINIPIQKENIDNSLLQEINFLNNHLKNMDQKFDHLFKEQGEEIKLLKEKTNYLLNNINNINNNRKQKIINEENQLIFKSNFAKLDNMKIISANIDGSRGVNDLFEVYNLYNEKKAVYIAVKCKDINIDIPYIDILKVTSTNSYNKVGRLFLGYKTRIVFIKYFINPYTYKEYLVTGDREEKIKVWEIINEMNYKLVCTIETKYGRLLMQQSLYSSILYFTEKRNYIYTTTVTFNNSRLYELENGSFVKDVSITLNNYTFYLIRYKDFIVDVCRNYVVIYNPFSEEIYAKIENIELRGDNRSACIIYNKNNTDYLNISNSCGYVLIYDLKNRVVNHIFNLNKELYHIIAWDLSNLIIAEYNSGFLRVVNIDNKRDNYLVKCQKYLICVKKALLNEKEEILITAGENIRDIYLYCSSNIQSS